MKFRYLFLLFVPFITAVLSTQSALAKPKSTIVYYTPDIVSGIAAPHHGPTPRIYRVSKRKYVKRHTPALVIYPAKPQRPYFYQKLSLLQRARFDQAFSRALTSPNKVIYWQENNVSAVISSQFGRNYSGQNFSKACRSYQQTVTIAGKRHTLSGIACRQPDSSWKIIS